MNFFLSGEGADELFGSYAYMQHAPSAAHLHREILRRLKLLHHYDVLRCDRATSCHGLEIRVPFLDKKFIDLVVRLPASHKIAPGKIEKEIIRSAFVGWLPEEVLWRSKEGFSEALGKFQIREKINFHLFFFFFSCYHYFLTTSVVVHQSVSVHYRTVFKQQIRLVFFQ